jgi:Glycosyl transferase family 11
MNKVSVYGGLGNQMFQYAFCTALNKKGKKARLSFSTYLFFYHHNGFNLATAFKLKLPFPFNLLSYFLLNGEALYKNKIAAGFCRRTINWYQKNIYKTYNEKKEFEYDAAVFQQHSCIFNGTWQAEHYFKDIEQTVQQQFVFKVPADAENATVIEKIKSCNAVSLHIRRGDYLTSHWGKSLAVIKDTSYYINAMEYIKQHTTNPHYFIFSDDMQWVKENLQIPDCTYIGHNSGKNSYVDMYLMSLCKHNIIANSTFSWWGAWLNKHLDKIVIMPEKWMNDNACNGIFPEEWIKLKV